MLSHVMVFPWLDSSKYEAWDGVNRNECSSADRMNWIRPRSSLPHGCCTAERRLTYKVVMSRDPHSHPPTHMIRNSLSVDSLPVQHSWQQQARRSRFLSLTSLLASFFGHTTFRVCAAFFVLPAVHGLRSSRFLSIFQFKARMVPTKKIVF